ncbi:hypothetical protein TTHERM_00218710 (macronuclear) [Tetrahymena thermophila SB210]|uniref:Uncharacterized protein n=1 Tax=Tetrahymena thermophila (strain SB210) TaxID=312017 RepID=I7LVX7_TETTS|nr:hypothetical protein TTHERM_00218710 [Tetrahymena thermophila SB210]EAS00298.1 hypothetical protein TTHERM_00218710 [Tetrahymena thermophila SB210]|eukprot:XP_001020543.1 hypothetical protein TTHERM_00218710 [Tetrahymena thermophila SB210]
MINKNQSSKSQHSPQSCTIKAQEKRMLDSQETSLTTMDTIDSPKESLVNNQLSLKFFQANVSSQKLQIASQKSLTNNNFSNNALLCKSYPIKNLSSQEIFSFSNNNDQIPAKQVLSTQLYQQCNNKSKQQLINELSLYKLTQIQLKNQLLAIQDKSDDQEEDDDNSDEEEEEYSIWDDDELRSMGIDTNFFIDIRGEELSFYQMYRLRSSLYQPFYISRLDTIKEAQIISSHYGQEIPINDLRSQQIYLDQFYLIQTKEFPRNPKLKSSQNVSNPVKSDQKCFTKRIQRVYSNFEQNDNAPSKQQYNQPKVSHQLNSTKLNKKELSQKQSNDLQNQENHSLITQKLTEINNAYSQLQDIPLNQKNRSQRRQKTSIDQEQALKLIQDKKIPIKQIKLYEGNFSQINIISNQSPSANNQLNQLNDNKNQANLLQQKTKITNQTQVSSEQLQNSSQLQQSRESSIQNTASSVLSYLKRVIYYKNNQEEQQIQRIPNLKQNLVDQNLSSPRNQKIEISKLNSKQDKKLQYEKFSQNHQIQQKLSSQLAK